MTNYGEAVSSQTETGLNPVTVRKTFIAVAFAEAVSWLGLLIGMYFKWIAQSSELGVKIFGPIHGAIFVFYVLVAIIAWRTFAWSFKTTLLALISAVPPFMTIWFERWAVSRDLLRAP